MGQGTLTQYDKNSNAHKARTSIRRYWRKQF